MGPYARTAVKLLLQNAVSFRCIAASVGVSLGFISKCKKELMGKKRPKAAQAGARRGRPRALTAARCTLITIGVHTYFNIHIHISIHIYIILHWSVGGTFPKIGKLDSV